MKEDKKRGKRTYHITQYGVSLCCRETETDEQPGRDQLNFLFFSVVFMRNSSGSSCNCSNPGTSTTSNNSVENVTNAKDTDRHHDGPQHLTTAAVQNGETLPLRRLSREPDGGAGEINCRRCLFCACFSGLWPAAGNGSETERQREREREESVGTTGEMTSFPFPFPLLSVLLFLFSSRRFVSKLKQAEE